MKIHISDGSHQPTVTADDLKRSLDEIEQALVEPTFIRLATDATVMQLGLVHPDGAVALFLDGHGHCWFSHGEITCSDTSFRNGDTRHDFNAHGTIAHPEPAPRPSSLREQPTAA